MHRFPVRVRLFHALTDEIRDQFRGNRLTPALLANDTLGNLPPLTFYRGLVVDLDGAQHDSLDVGVTGISPVADAMRVFALSAEEPTPSTTLGRLDRAALNFPDGAAIFADTAEAFRIAH